MKIIQRISNSQKHVDFLLKVLEKYPGCFTDVWLNTAYGYPKNEDHFKAADECAVLAEQLRRHGVTVSLQLSNTLGHGQYMMTRDCSGLVEYLLDLCKCFNRFYRECPVVSIAAADPELAASRLALAQAVRRVVSDGLSTLTIGVPEAM